MATQRPGGRLHLLTAREVMAADADGADGGGLLLRVRDGSASWAFRYSSPAGRKREMGLGVCHRASVAQAGASLTAARDLAHKARDLLRRNVDPLDDRQRQREEAAARLDATKSERERDAWTLARCAHDYHERVIEPSRTAVHAAQWIASLENHIPAALWHRPICDVAAPELLRTLLAIRPHERARNVKGERLAETVRRIRQRLDAVFEDAIFHGRASGNPAAALRRKLREATPARERGSHRALPYREAPALVQRIRATPGTAARCLEFAILTAARTGEVIGAQWSEIDLAAATWCVPASRMKAGEPHTVPLAERALEIVKAQAGQDARWIFPSPMTLGQPDGQRRPLSNMALLACLDRLDARERTTVHGLCRATFSTWANETGAARPDVIEACLAHTEGNRVRAAYNRAEFAAERRALLERWADHLAHCAEVITLRRGAA